MPYAVKGTGAAKDNFSYQYPKYSQAGELFAMYVLAISMKFCPNAEPKKGAEGKFIAIKKHCMSFPKPQSLHADRVLSHSM